MESTPAGPWSSDRLQAEVAYWVDWRHKVYPGQYAALQLEIRELHEKISAQLGEIHIQLAKMLDHFAVLNGSVARHESDLAHLKSYPAEHLLSDNEKDHSRFDNADQKIRERIEKLEDAQHGEEAVARYRKWIIGLALTAAGLLVAIAAIVFK